GCNPDDIVRRYRETFKDQDSAASPVQLESDVNVTCPPGQVLVRDIDAMTRRRSRTAWVSGGAVLLVGAALHFALTPTASWKIERARARQAPKPETSSTASPPEPAAPAAAPSAAATIGTTGSHDGALDRPTEANTLHLEVKPSGDCWLSATADGQRVIY